MTIKSVEIEGVASVIIPEKDYYELVEASRFLDALEGAGVDNWDGYSDAQEMLGEWDSEQSS